MNPPELPPPPKIDLKEHLDKHTNLEQDLVDDLWRMKLDRDRYRSLFIITTVILVFALLLSAAWISLAGRTSEKEVVVKFEPEMIRYTNSALYNNNIQAPHSIIPLNEVERALDPLGLNLGKLYGHSMQPTFFEGNYAILTRIWQDPEYDLKTGEVVRFFRTDENNTCPDIFFDNFESQLGGSWVNNSMAVIHRISAKYDDDSIVMQGDNLYEQEVIRRCQITDVVVGILFT